ncbi:MAG: preprotein translocase subunit YajC [Clostridia bacterium]|nr:preprotein translocase subunit YajC [Clostridia bacterium]
MLLNLISFFEETPQDNSGWITWIVLGVMLVGLILLTVIPQKKQKKKTEEMMSKIGVGSEIITIGGIVGKIVELDDLYVTIKTGEFGQESTIKLLRQGIHSLVPDGTEAADVIKSGNGKKDETDEIK